MKELKVVFMGTPEFGVPILTALIESCTVIGVVCQPDRENKKIGAIKTLALSHNIPIYQPENIKNDYQAIIDLHPDIIITCAYGQIIPKVLLNTPKYGSINVHASLLPRWRGGAPIHRAIMNGDTKTGITILYMTERLDAGAIIKQREIPISSEDTTGIVHDRLQLIGRDLLMEVLPDIIANRVHPIKQKEDEVTYALTLEKDDEHIDFSKSKREIYNQIRGLNPWPGAYCLIEAKVLKVWNARMNDDVHTDRFDGEIVRLYDDGIGIKTNNGEIVFTEVQLEGRTRMSTKDFLNGLRDKKLLIGKICE